jgi:ABC-type antimicrobial peptide transport system permease subunit
MRHVVSNGLVLTAIGMAAGAGTALEVTRLMGYLLYHVSPRDPLAFASAFLIVTIASLTACMVPAWRATRTDPIRALRG